MENIKIGTKIKIIEMLGEPAYTGRIGTVTHIDDAKQLHGTWGDLAIIHNVDKIEIIDNEVNKDEN